MRDAMKPLTIGKVASRSDIGIETIRFYEREGLIDAPPRTESGYRQYPEAVILRIKFIQRAKELGFSLKDIKELLSLRVDPETTCKDILAKTQCKISEIDDKIQILQKMKGILISLATDCKGRGPISDCPILEALDQEQVNENR